ncbi:MAG: TRAP transporter large permease subunit [Candidatus Marinimicrobia bacterium]|jgi:tripartite ATP-independent transporter DctM subunit|nr:TRAP transporter large permease subunit [Candidatus Neomarinimicrobiota bacterium]HJM47364.1 TRAP transporter large permease subunit [Candidatus Neomarinimicrobiota bacterium]|tara:strand:+ start:26888 stop:28702 length:1815 start_codon:yes stop_codon:yes gene_type:complete
MNQNKSMDSHEVHLTDKLKWGEDVLAISVFFAITFLPFYDIIARIFQLNSIPASQVIIQHLTLWTGFLGAVLATRQNKLLALTTRPLFISDDNFDFGRWISKSVSFIILCALIWGSIQLIKTEFQFTIDIAPHIPRWAAQIIMPIGFIFIALEVIIRSGNNAMYRSSILMMTIGWYIICLSGNLQDSGWFSWIGSFIILFCVYQGLPIFLALGGLSALYFWIDYTPIAAIAAETYRIVVSPTLPTIPLFTLAGYILAESGAPKRIYKFFTHAFGWLQGGTPVIVVLLCSFFTALTGGSGVTILALGGILYPLLTKEGYSEKFSLGLITVSGSLGLLFPPSLPVIIYGVTAGVNVKDLFIQSFFPGVILVLSMVAWVYFQGKRHKIEKSPFNWDKLKDSFWEAKWEIILPFLILTGVFSGYMTLVETAAFTVVYILTVEVLIYKDLPLKDLPKIIIDCATLIGGVLIILGVAMGLTSYLVDAQVPMRLLEWIQSTISSKLVFLLLLNILLLVIGCMMDIFSAIIVFVPLIAPLGIFFQIDPIHLAIIFIANLELGFFTPPIGMNLFLSAYRFNKSMPVLYNATIPFFLIRLLFVLILTYIPLLFY